MSDKAREAEDLRQELARLDAHLVATLDERARAARRLGEVRRDNAPAMPVADHAAIQALVEQSSGDMPRDALREVLREVFAAGLSLELPVKVAFVGSEGGPGHAAARGRFGGGKSNLVPAETPGEALEEVSRKRAEFAVVPFETSTEGPLHSTILALMNRDLRISEILDDAFDLHLMTRASSLVDVCEAGQGDDAGTAAAPPANIDKVYATASDHALCGRFLESLAPRVSVVQVKNARMACQLAVEERGAGAVATERFGALFGLEVARRDVRDAESPRVRHAVVGSRPSGRTGNEATSFVFSVQDAPGSLLDVLRVFAERGIRLTKIQSHPGHHDDRMAWSYLFYVEAAGHFTDRPLVTAFEEIKRMTRVFRLLGSYPLG